LLQAIFTAGYKAILHIHSVVEECEIMGLIHQIDPKTKKPIRKKILFVKNGAVVVVRIQVGTQLSFHILERKGICWFLEGNKVEGFLAASLPGKELISRTDKASV